MNRKRGKQPIDVKKILCCHCQKGVATLRRQNHTGGKPLLFCSLECNLKNLEGMIVPANPRRFAKYSALLDGARKQFEDAKSQLAAKSDG